MNDAPEARAHSGGQHLCVTDPHKVFTIPNHSELTVLLLAHAPVSSSTIPASLDKQMDKQTPSNGHVMPGVSIRNGPVTEDTTMPDVNGAASAKRKARESMARPNYAESESSDDDKPLVCSYRQFVCKDLND